MNSHMIGGIRALKTRDVKSLKHIGSEVFECGKSPSVPDVRSQDLEVNRSLTYLQNCATGQLMGL